MIRLDYLLYGGIVVIATAMFCVGYVIFKRARAHSAKHKPEVMNKINDFLGTQDAKYTN